MRRRNTQTISARRQTLRQLCKPSGTNDARVQCPQVAKPFRPSPGPGLNTFNRHKAHTSIPPHPHAENPSVSLWRCRGSPKPRLPAIPQIPAPSPPPRHDAPGPLPGPWVGSANQLPPWGTIRRLFRVGCAIGRRLVSSRCALPTTLSPFPFALGRGGVLSYTTCPAAQACFCLTGASLAPVLVLCPCLGLRAATLRGLTDASLA